MPRARQSFSWIGCWPAPKTAEPQETGIVSFCSRGHLRPGGRQIGCRFIMADTHFDRALRAAARRGRTAEVCPEAEALAAFVDRGLSREEHAAIERHASDCARCAQHLALLSSVDTPAASTAAVRAKRPFLLAWAWLVPVATVVLVVAVWLRTPDPRDRESAPAMQISLGGQRTPKPSASEKSADAVSPHAPVRPTEPTDDAAEARLQRATPHAAREEGQARVAGARAKDAASTPETASQPELEMRAAGTPQQQAKEELQAGSDRPAAPPAAHEAVVAEQKVRPRVPAGGNDAAAQSAPAPVAMADAQVGRARGGAEGRDLLMKRATLPRTIEAGTVRYRFGDALGERSTDGGVTWTAELSGVGLLPASASCPSTEVCWVGGPDGAVFVRTAAGWTRRTVPGSAPVLRISASDARRATASLENGEQLATTDAGVNWTPAPPTP